MREVGRFAQGLVLSCLAGWLDAVGFLKFSGLYMSFMSGNTVQFGIGLASSDGRNILPPACALTSFGAGAVVGGLMFGLLGRWAFSIILALEAACLSLGAYAIGEGLSTWLGYVPLAFGMGLQNHLLARGRADYSGTTFVTGTLFRFGDALARLALGTERFGLPLRIFAVLCVFALGAWAGAAAELRRPDASLLLPAALTIAMASAALAASLVVSVQRARRSRGRTGASDRRS